MRKIIVPAGIGDSIWLLQLLINQPEKFHFILPAGHPRRGKQVFDILPQITGRAEYSEDRRLTYNYLSEHNAHHKAKLFAQIKDQMFFLSANEWLENGNRLENFLMDLSISYQLPWQTQQYKNQVDQDLKEDEVCIGIYGSSYSTSRAWGFWQEKEWFELIKMINKQRKNITFCIIGADWDTNLADGLFSLLTKAGIKFKNVVGKDLGYVIELMKQLDYAFYFPSGLPILSETLENKTDCVMFYPKHLEPMMTKWCDPKRTQSEQFKECQFCSPVEIFDWVMNVYCLDDKLPK